MKLSQVKLKLAKMLVNFEEITENGKTYTYEGALDYGTEVFIEEDGNLVPATEGEFYVEETKYTVEAGKVFKINDTEEIVEAEMEEVEEVVEEIKVEAVEESIDEVIEEIDEAKEEVIIEEVIEEKDEYFNVETFKKLLTDLENLKEEVEKLKDSLEEEKDNLQNFKSEVSNIELARPVDTEVKDIASKDIKGAGKYFAAAR